MDKSNRIGRVGRASIGSRRELVEVRGYVHMDFLNWFDEQSGNTREQMEMLERSYFEEVGD